MSAFQHIDANTLVTDDRTVISFSPVIFYRASVTAPPVATELIVIIHDPDEPDLVREFAQVDKHGVWSLISGDPFELTRNHPVLWWAYPPAFPRADRLTAAGVGI